LPIYQKPKSAGFRSFPLSKELRRRLCLTRTSTTLADLVYAAILCRDFFGSAGIAEAVA